MSTKAAITCPDCGQRFSATPPMPESPMNALKFSTVMALHPSPVKCGNSTCQSAFVFVAQAVEITWNIVQITPEQAQSMSESRIVLPDAGLKLVH